MGNGSLNAVIYAPRGDVTIRGNGAVQGAIVADTITFTGNANFHYDQALSRLGDHAPFKAAGWRLLSGQSARDQAGLFQGW